MEKAYGRTLIALTVILALVLSSFVYAAWRETITVEGTVNTGELDWAFTEPLFQYDNGLDWTCDENFNNWEQLSKDVGSTTLEYSDTDRDGDYDLLSITINNAYPGYANEIDFHVVNNGDIPLIFEKVIIDGNTFTNIPIQVALDLNGDGNADVKIEFGNNLGGQLHPGEEFDISIGILVLQPAPEGASLELSLIHI